MRMLRSRACRKRPENADRQPAACIFGRARSIAIDSTISTGALLNLRETRHEFSHSLGRLLTKRPVRPLLTLLRRRVRLLATGQDYGQPTFRCPLFGSSGEGRFWPIGAA